MNREVLFDVDGLITYPGFPQLVNELTADKVPVRFWSYANRQSVDARLSDHGLSRFKPRGIRSITTEAFEINEWFKRYNNGENPDLYLELIKQNLRILRRPTRDRELTRVHTRAAEWEQWLRKFGMGFKYPPILGDKSFLLVESDCAFRHKQEPPYQSKLSNADFTAASAGQYSLILVPEHPTVWEGPSQFASPAVVMSHLREKVLNWNGQHMVHDLGQELGVYESYIQR